MKKYFLIILFISLGVFTFGNNNSRIKEVKKENTTSLEFPFIISFFDNPSFAGARERHVINAQYREKWPGFDASLQDVLFSYDFSILNDKKVAFGFGGAYNYNQFGSRIMARSKIAFSIRYMFNKTTKLRWGTSFSSYSISAVNDEIYPDMLHPLYGPIYDTQESKSSGSIKNSLDFSSGIWFSRDKLFSGISFLHLNQLIAKASEKENYQPCEMRFVLGNRFSINNNFEFTPMIEFHKINTLPLIINPSGIISYKSKIFLGLSFNNLKMLDFNIRIVLFNHLSVSVNQGIFIKNQFGDLSRISNKGIALRYEF